MNVAIIAGSTRPGRKARTVADWVLDIARSRGGADYELIDPDKNAIDYLFAEWNDKAAGFVGYGAVGGMRAVEHLRLVLGELKVADVRCMSPTTSPTSPTSPRANRSPEPWG